jgi:hypothetical protein
MSFKRVLFDFLGLVCCLAPPIACTCSYFPVWKQTVGTWSMVGGTAALVAIIVFIVLAKYFRNRIKTPSPVVVFLFLWLFFMLIEQTIGGLKMVAFWGFFGSVVGTVFFWLSDRTGKKG